MPSADELLGPQTVEDLTRVIGFVLPTENLPHLRGAPAQVSGLPLRARVDLLQSALLADIPGGYPALAQVVRTALRQTSAPEDDAQDSSAPRLEGWMVWPVTEAVAAQAVADGGTAAFDDALGLLADLTGLLTAEFAIRTLLRHDPNRALSLIRTWTDSDDAHVRRLASEGTRPYLPWGTRIPALAQTPRATVPVLDALYRDPSDYVRRSVANHLNDLSREHPRLVVDTADRWLAAPDAHTAWVVRHSLRTLVKRGDPAALALLGFPSAEAALTIEGPSLDRGRVRMGESVELRATLQNTSDAPVRLAIDYVVHHRRANGSQSPKTFKLTTTTLEPGERFDVRRSHAFRPITTRRYYTGRHAIALQINGLATARAEFILDVD